MAHAPRRYTWLMVLILGGIAIGMAVKTCRDAPPARMAPRAVAAPVPAGLAQTFGAVDDGQTVHAAVGERFAVVQKSWTEWRVEAAPPFLRHVDTLTGPSEDSTHSGTDQWQVFVFEVGSPGEGELTLHLVRPWEDDAPLDQYRLTVRATDQAGL